MAYAEKVPSPKGDYWRGRFQDLEGRYLTVCDEHGRGIRFERKADAKMAAADAESDVRNGRHRDRTAGAILFRDWATEWYAGFNLAASTMANRKRHLEQHLIPAFGHMMLRNITPAAVARWEELKKGDGYAASSVQSWRRTLYTCLEDAVGTHIAVNPVARKRGRGRRSGSDRKTGNRGREKVITSPLGVLLIAERMSILTGRDDEFVMVQTAYWHALRLAELIGLERENALEDAVRIGSQLSEVEGKLIDCPPKDDSYGTTLTPLFLRGLIAAHSARSRPQPCPCHGKVYLFRGFGTARPKTTVPLRVVASAARVDESTAGAVLSGRGRVSDETRRRVLEAAALTGYEVELAPDGPARHWRRSPFEQFFTAAASGWLPPKKPRPKRPVLLAGEWPGTRVQGRGAEGRAEFCWLPVAEGLTPHSLRHSLKSWMEEHGVPEVLSEEVMRHDIPGISGTYRHVTPGMRRELAAAQQRAWEEALGERLAMSPRSPVRMLDGLLRERLEARKPALVPRDSPEKASGVIPLRTSSLVGVRGLEPRTSSLSGKHPTLLRRDVFAGHADSFWRPQVRELRSLAFDDVRSHPARYPSPGFPQASPAPGSGQEKR